jgi:hypothetical protein
MGQESRQNWRAIGKSRFTVMPLMVKARSCRIEDVGIVQLLGAVSGPVPVSHTRMRHGLKYSAMSRPAHSG